MGTNKRYAGYPADYPNIVRWLVTHGYKDEEIARAIGGNALRVMKQVWVR